MAAEAAPMPLPDPGGAPPAALEDYVQQRIQQFNAQPQLSRLLGAQAAAALQDATAQLLAAGATGGEGPAEATGGEASAASPVPQPTLVFRHDCRHLGCPDAHCLLCAQNPARRCSRTFCPKYLAGDPLKAACGAPIRVELIDGATGRLIVDHPPTQLQARGSPPPLPARLPPCQPGPSEPRAAAANRSRSPPATCIQIRVVEGKAYEGLAAADVAPTNADLDRGQPLLTAKQAPSDSHGRVLLPLSKGRALLPDLSVTGSSEALLSGQRPPFALLLLALHAANGERREDIPPAGSEGFVVATPRVRSASKRAIPKLSDHVSKLTAAKLRDLSKAAVEAGVKGLELPLPSATTVGEFCQLVEWAQQDAEQCDAVKKMLKLTRGWEEARDHALRAVGDDSRLRAFFPDDSLATGLLFGCEEASPKLDAALAVLSIQSDSRGQRTLQATVLSLGGDAQTAPESGQGREDGRQGAGLLRLQVNALLQQAKVMLPAEVAAVAAPLTPHSGARSMSAPASLLPPPAAAPAAGPSRPHTLSISQQQAGRCGVPSPPFFGPPRASPSPAPPLSTGGDSSPPPSGSGRCTPREQSAMVQEFASLGVQSPLTPWQTGQPRHPLAFSPFDAAAGPGAAATQRPNIATAAALSAVAGHAPVAARPAAPAPPRMAPQQQQQQPLAGFVPVQPTGGGAAGSGGSGPPMPLHLQLQSSGRLPAGSPEESSSGQAFGQEISLNPPAAAIPPEAALPPAGPAGAAAALPRGPAQQSQLARLLSDLPPLGLFGPGGPLSLGAIGELDAAVEGAGAGAAVGASMQSLCDVFGGREATVDWEQLLREAYKPDAAPPSHLPPAASGSGTAPLQGALSAEDAAGLLRMLSHASAAAQDLARLGTLPDWDGMLTDLPPTMLGDAAAASGGGLEAPAQKRQMLRYLTPEWTKLLSLSAADWAALLPPGNGPRDSPIPGAGPAQAQAQAPAEAAAPAAATPHAADAAAAFEAAVPEAAGRQGRKRQLSFKASGPTGPLG